MTRSNAVPPEINNLLRSLPGQNLLLLPDAPAFSIVSVNDSLCLALKTEREHLIGKSIFEILPADASGNVLPAGDGLQTALRKALSEKMPQELPVQKRMVRENGTAAPELKYWQPKTIPVLDDSGQVVYLLHSVADVTPGMQHAKEILCGQRIEGIASISNNGIWEWDLLTNEICLFGKEFFRAFGNKLVEAAPPEGWQQLIHPEDRDRVTSHFEAAAADPTVQLIDEMYRVRKTNGDYADVSDKAKVVRDANGKATFIYGLVTDITLRKKQDIEKEILIADLTKDNFDLKQFAYTTTHNLRSPIANLMALGKLLDENRIEDSQTRKTVEQYKLAALQLNKNVNELFELLKQNTAPESQVKAVALEEVFRQVVASMSTQIAECGAEITTDFAGGKMVNFIPGYLHSIFLNLLSNAIKYRSAERKLQIRVFTELQDDSLLLHFSDNGLGIDLKKYGEKVFGLYQKFHDHPDSTGLGLHIVATQVKAMGGSIWVNSQPDSGSTFTIQFKN